MATALMHKIDSTRNQTDHASVPVPKPWITAIGHDPYASQWTARHAAGPMNPRRRLVTTIAASSSKAMVPRPSHSVR